MSPQPWYVYLLECHGARIYTGITPRLEERLAAHHAGRGARFTRMHKPERLLAARRFSDRSTALREEWRIKRLSAGDKRDLAMVWARDNEVGEPPID